MYIDTHCHLSKGDYTDIDQVIKESVLAGVSPIIVSFCNKENMKEAKELSTKYKEVYITLGYHPEEAEKIKKEDILSLEEQLKESKVVGIGEIGLDYHYGKDQKDKQITLFEEQLQLAEKNHLPVVIHSRDATEDTLLILEKYRQGYPISKYDDKSDDLIRLCGYCNRYLEIIYKEGKPIYAELSDKYNVAMANFNHSDPIDVKCIVERIDEEIDAICGVIATDLTDFQKNKDEKKRVKKD